MKTINDSLFKTIFILAGFWNFSIGITGILFTDFSIGLFFGPDAVTTDFLAILFFRLFMAAVMIFGAGYFIVSRELMLNRGIIWLGLGSKLLLFFIFLIFFILGNATLIAFLAVTGDFLWSLIFILFLHQTVNRVKINTVIG